MKKSIVLLIVFFASLSMRAQENGNTMTIQFTSNTKWWAGIIQDGHKMPIKNGFEANFSDPNWWNQLQPLLLSNDGELVWSEEPFSFAFRANSILIDNRDPSLVYKKVGNNLKEAYLYASTNYFPPSGKMPPDIFFLAPQYNTWMELTYNQNQKDILKYANAIIDNGMPPGIIMIDDNWQEDYGNWNFHSERFTNPHKMVKELKRLGFDIMLWVCPFVSPDSKIYRELLKRNVFMMEKNGEPAMIRWWNGVSAELDLTRSEGVEWFKGELNILRNEFGIDGFKFDAGESWYYTNSKVVGANLKLTKGVSSLDHTKLFSAIGLDYPYNEYRTTWKMGGQPLVQRLADKGHSWEDLRSLIPQMLLEGIMGYPFSCPDMIGGGWFLDFVKNKNIDQELVVRSAQIHALMPMMQFSMAPWRILDKKHFLAVLDAIQLRNKFRTLILDLAKNAAVSGEPIVRSMEYVFPFNGFADINDQFMLGDDILIAPYLKKGEGKRKVMIPDGKWQSDEGIKIEGGRIIEIEVPINRLPYFAKMKN